MNPIVPGWVVRYQERVEFTLDERTSGNAYFVLGVRKSGSSILNSIIEGLAKLNGVPYIDVAGKLFAAGFSVKQWQRDRELSAILRDGHVYGGFRNCPLCFQNFPLFEHGRKVLMVRDPRDALVSEYFSNAYSHSIPVAGTSKNEMLKLRQRANSMPIDEYVLTMAEPMKQVLQEFAGMKQDPLCRIFRYEDVIFEKGQLIADICEFFGWTIGEQQKKQILGWADVVPSEERPTEFIRRVTPGDHVEKLSVRVVEQLNNILAKELGLFGY
jgi:hypothetical protein